MAGPWPGLVLARSTPRPRPGTSGACVGVREPPGAPPVACSTSVLGACSSSSGGARGRRLPPGGTGAAPPPPAPAGAVCCPAERPPRLSSAPRRPPRGLHLELKQLDTRKVLSARGGSAHGVPCSVSGSGPAAWPLSLSPPASLPVAARDREGFGECGRGRKACGKTSGRLAGRPFAAWLPAAPLQVGTVGQGQGRCPPEAGCKQEHSNFTRTPPTGGTAQKDVRSDWGTGRATGAFCGQIGGVTWRKMRSPVPRCPTPTLVSTPLGHVCGLQVWHHGLRPGVTAARGATRPPVHAPTDS